MQIQIPITLVIPNPLVLTSQLPLPAPALGQPYSYRFTVAGGSGNYRWSVLTGQLPPGLALAADGTLSGTPTAPGTYTAMIQVDDAGN